MNILQLLRHAKASPAGKGLRDFDRPLDADGRRQAEAVGIAMRERRMLPGTILCSPARRTRETLDGLALGPAAGAAAFPDRLYDSTVETYLDAIRQQGGCPSLLVVGHNPMIEDLAVLLTAEEDRAAYRAGFATASMAVLRFGRTMDGIAPGAGRLLAFIGPARA